ncbi:MAG: 3D domain-containing protein [Acidobacteriota bacterium]
MGVNNSQFGYLRLAVIMLAAPIAFSAIVPDQLANATQRANSKKRQRASSNQNSEEIRSKVRQQILAEIPNLLLHEQSLDESFTDIHESEYGPTQTFVATAYCIKNVTACGVMVRPGIIAADPKVIPLGSIVRLKAGKYSGTYRVLDTGPAIRGTRLDIYVSCRSEAISFGRRKVEVEVLRYGWGDENKSAMGQ